MYIALPNGDIYSKWSNKILKSHLSKRTGYKSVSMVSPITKRKKTINVHQYVAYFLVEGYAEDLVVNHIDGNRINNSINNLEWVIQKDNVQKAIQKGTRDFSKEKHPMYNKTHGEVARRKISEAKKKCIGKKHWKSRPVIVYNYESNSLVGEYESINLACKDLGISQGNASMNLVNKRKHANNYIFRYKIT